MTASARGSTRAGSDRQARRLADLAARLTPRDRQLCRLVAEHRVLTSHQLADLAFNHLDTAEDRLRTLTTLEVLDRFRPRRDTGSAPYHYVLGPLGAAVLAAEQGIGVADLGYRRAATLAIAHHRRLPELVRANGFFAALAGHARRHPDAELALWWSQRRCQATWGALIRPHGFGRWRQRDAVLDFFLVCDNAVDAPGHLTAALAGYDELARANPRLATITLVWTTTADREAEVRRVLPFQACLLATATEQGRRNPVEAVDPWPILRIPTAGPWIGRERCSVTTASGMLEHRCAIKATGWRGSAAAEYQRLPARGPTAAERLCGRRAATHPGGGS
jgi:hypothetical protein